MVESFASSFGPAVAPKGRRIAEGLIDLVIIPILLGLVIGFVLVPLPEIARSVILILVNVAWLVFRDFVYSPGRAMVGLKLVSLSGDKVTLLQAFLRNILLMIPFVLIIGYIVETVFILVKGERLADTWAKTRVILA